MSLTSSRALAVMLESVMVEWLNMHPNSVRQGFLALCLVSSFLYIFCSLSEVTCPGFILTRNKESDRSSGEEGDVVDGEDDEDKDDGDDDDGDDEVVEVVVVDEVVEVVVVDEDDDDNTAVALVVDVGVDRRARLRDEFVLVARLVIWFD